MGFKRKKTPTCSQKHFLIFKCLDILVALVFFFAMALYVSSWTLHEFRDVLPRHVA